MANSFEESTHSLLAGGDFAPKAGTDSRAWVRHRLSPGHRDSDCTLHRGRRCLAAECAGDASSKLRGDAGTADSDAAVCPVGWLDVFVGTAVHAWRRGYAHSGGVAGDCWTDGFLADAWVDSRVAEDSVAGERARRVRLRIRVI